MMRRTMVLLGLLAMLYSCKEQDKGYSFFVAGHTYGVPNGSNTGLHPPFLSEFDKLNADPMIDMGFFTGDIVRKSDTASWDAVDAQLKDLRMPVYFSPGNHDTYNRKLYDDRYGKSYFSFYHKGDLIIILDGNLSNWNIEGEQLSFLEDCIRNADMGTENIFVFVHQLIWWDEHNVFAGVHLNWPPYTPDTTNYWAEVEPLLQQAGSPVYIFAGDLGANREATPVMYYHDQNITYIASGMGSIDSDNYILVSRDGNGGVTFELIALGGESDRLGKMEDYDLSLSE
ncbi:MAG TPA: metallophosphoesterase [Bacteroidales bacterium]|nr:metallophosphoesterase [Bacteroidales bacterium]